MAEIKDVIKGINKLNYTIRYSCKNLKLDGIQDLATSLLISAADIIDAACDETGWSRAEMLTLIGIAKDEAKKN